ncbi:MAG: histidinol dehydrogenase, partial [Planctomycetaceae bacterium]|nr:histidinol dehydrogenase [Planctomycetaceae bacterium]
ALPAERRRYCEAFLSGTGAVVATPDLDESAACVNAFAPEHLEVLTRSPHEVLPRIRNAGEILLGPYTPITVGNFSLGVNAILPTGGFARTFSCVGVHDFLKRSSFAYASKEGFGRLSGPASILAEFEGFPAHKRAIEWRGSL